MPIVQNNSISWSMTQGRPSRFDDRLPDDLAFHERTHGLHGARERETGADMRADSLRGEQPVDGGDVLTAFLRKAAAILAGPHACDRESFDQGNVGSDGGNAAAGESDDEQASVEGDAARGFVEDVAADRIVNDVGTLASRQLLHGFPKSRRGQGMVGTIDRKSTRLNSSHVSESRMPSSS